MKRTSFGPLPLAGFFVSAIATLWGASAQAAVVEAYDVEELAARASDVVQGEVLDMKAMWVKKHIVTDVEIKVERCYKGPCESRVIVVRVLGGQVGDLVMSASGMAQYTPGERVLLFLEPRGATNDFRTTGLAQGKFRIQASARGPLASRDAKGLQLFGMHKGAAEQLHEVELSTLVGRIDSALDRLGR